MSVINFKGESHKKALFPELELKQNDEGHR